MQETLNQLISLQKIDTRIEEIKSIISNMPQQVKLLNDKLEKAVLEYNSLDNELSENKKAYTDIEKDVIEKKELLSSSQIKLSSVQNSKEYESVLRELDVLKKSIAEGEAKLKEMSNLNSKYESEHTSAKEITEGIKKQLEELTNSKKDEDQELHDELESLQIKREEVATPIKKSFLAKYDRVRVHRNNLGIVSVNDEVCNGCYMRIPPQLFVDVKKNKSIHSCPHCQRILYFEEKEQQKETKE